jgi:hypothetical protein
MGNLICGCANTLRQSNIQDSEKPKKMTAVSYIHGEDTVRKSQVISLEASLPTII